MSLLLSLASAYSQPLSAPKILLQNAQSLAAAGNIEQASAAFQSAISLAATHPDPAELPHALDLACTHFQDVGEPAQAEPCLRRLLSAFERKLGPGHLGLNRIVNRLACLYIEIGQRAKAERLDIPRWLARLEAAAPLSDDRVNLTGTMAALEILRGNPAAAVRLNESAWEILDGRGMASSDSGITVLNNLSIAYLETRQFAASERVLLRAIALGGSAGIDDTLSMAATHANLANLYVTTRRYADADPHMATALTIVERRCGRNSIRTAALLASYVPILKKLGRKSEARLAQSRARQIGAASAVAAHNTHTVDITDLARSGRKP